MAESDSKLGGVPAFKQASSVPRWLVVPLRRNRDWRDSMASGAIRHRSVDIVLGPLSRFLAKLDDLLTGEYKLHKVVKGDIRFLKPELQLMKAALEMLSNTPPDQLDIQDKIWARELRDLCYNIDDSIDKVVVFTQLKYYKLRDIKEFADRTVLLLEYANKIAVRFLQSELESIQAVLEKLSSKPADRIQARHLRELSHDIADNIVTFMAYSEGNMASNLRGLKECINRSVRLLDYTNNIPTKIKDINSRVTGMHGPHRSYDVNLGAVDLYTQTEGLDGIDERRDELINILIEETRAPIVGYGGFDIRKKKGYGGLGKTTLANAVHLMPVNRSVKDLCYLDLEDCNLSQGYSLNEFGKLFQLRYLGLCGTRIAQLPEEIGNLRNLRCLEYLDVRHTNISRLPSTVVQLPNRIGELTSLHMLSTLGIDDSTMGVTEELGQLTGPRVLDIILSGKWNRKLVEYIGKVQNIQTPEVDISEEDLEEAEAAPRHAAEVHPNRPALLIGTTNKRDSKSRVKDVHQKHEYRYKIDSVVAEPVTATVFPCLFTQYMKVPNLVGHEEAVNELMKILTERTEMSLAHGKIVSIVGLGGLGKTTFAHAIYRKLRAQFDCCAFVSISQNPDIKKLLKCMLYELGKKNYANIHDGILDERQLIYELNEFLQKRRYFIVIDDIRDILVWNIIKSALPTNDGGFIIATTTCILDVAKQVGGIYMMRPLCPQNSRILLHRKTFGTEDKDEYADEELTEISEKILQKCGGIPLAIIATSGLLASKGQNKIDWYKVYNSIDSIVKNSPDVDSLKKILSLNYDDLPSHLRTCLLYLSVFPEGHDIDKDRLVRLWIAEGLIQCGKQEDSPFELGESYFYELMNRSMIQPVYKRWYYDMTECCQVHDLVLHLIRYLSDKEKLVSIWDHMHDKFHSNEIQWLSLQNSMVDIAIHEAAVNMQEVRSVVVFPSAVKLLPALACFKVLRVLDLQSCCLSQGCSLKYLGNLFHLRYLGLRGTGIASLSEEKGKLQFLQTLDVTGNEISSLPFTVAELKHLMCLHIDSRTGAPNGIGSFTSLEELSTLRIQDSTDIIEKLGNQTELRVLGIDCRTGWNVNRVERSLLDCLHKLQKIKTLSISMVGECNLDAWVPPRYLRRLELTGCWRSPVSALLNNASLLVELYFLSIEVRKLRQEDLESLGRLPALSYLDLEVGNQKLGIVQTLVIGACSFPCLVHCTLRGYIGPVAFRQGAMPEVARLHLVFPVREIREAAAAGANGGGFDLGFDNLPRLQDVSFLLRRGSASKGEVQEAEAALRQAIESHPNHPTLDIL